MTPNDTPNDPVIETTLAGAGATMQPEQPAAEGANAPPSWLEQDDLLRDLWLKNEQPQAIADKLGRSMAAVMTRAVRLGLPRRAAPGRKPGYRRMGEGGVRPVAKERVSGAVSRMAAEVDALHDADQARRTAQQAMRVCLMCLKKFMSQGSHNRICPSCKGTSQYVAASSLPDMNYKIET